MTYARMSTIQVEPGKIDDFIALAAKHVTRVAEQHHGFQGEQLCVDRDAGKAYSFTLWNSREDALAAAADLIALQTIAAADMAKMGMKPVVTELLEVVTQTTA